MKHGGQCFIDVYKAMSDQAIHMDFMRSGAILLEKMSISMAEGIVQGTIVQRVEKMEERV